MGFRVEGPLSKDERKDLEDGYYIMTDGAFGPWMHETAKWHIRQIALDRKELAEAISEVEGHWRNLETEKEHFFDYWNSGKITTLVQMEEAESDVKSAAQAFGDSMEAVVRCMDGVRGTIDYLKENFPEAYAEWAKNQTVIETTGIRPRWY